MASTRDTAERWAARPLDPSRLHRFSHLVGRSNERPEREFAYWFESHLPDGQIALRRPGSEERFTGQLSDFRDYGDLLQERVNPALDAALGSEVHRIRERMVADLDWQWDTHGLVEEGNQALANFVDPNLMKASPEILEEVFRRRVDTN
jgi:hypothetical protein